jgi:class 3 adenylate cyclase
MTLAFRDRDEEAEYIAHHYSTSLVPARWAIMTGFVTLLLFAYMDYHIFTEYYPILWLSRAICATYILFGFALSYTSCFRRLMQLIVASGVVLVGLLAVWLIYITSGHPFCSHLYVGIVICVVFACIFLRLRFVWAAGSSLLMLAIFLAVTRPLLLPGDAYFIDAVYLSLATFSSILGAYSIEINLRHNFWQARQLERARLQYEKLLHSILPVSIAARLNAGEPIIADDKEVTVLFADIVGSVDLAARLGNAKDLVTSLNKVFLDFDQLVEQYELETVKTIGDGYMVTGNCSRAHAQHTRDVVSLALDMRATIREHLDADGTPLQLRIGIHTGPVVAGVMNLRKLSYDLWGDTVNVASRMESHAGPGIIQVTKEVFDKIGSEYQVEGPLAIEVKGKGTMSVYHLLGRADAIGASRSVPVNERGQRDQERRAEQSASE